jgi:hypothetical protein
MDAQKFHDTLVQEFDLQAYSPQEQQQYIDQLGELVLQGVLVKSFSAITDEQADQMEQALGQGMAPEEMMNLLQSMIPGFAELVRDEVMQVKQDLANGTGSDPVNALSSDDVLGQPTTESDSIFG